jgi:hypothetical protein
MLRTCKKWKNSKQVFSQSKEKKHHEQIRKEGGKMTREECRRKKQGK